MLTIPTAAAYANVSVLPTFCWNVPRRFIVSTKASVKSSVKARPPAATATKPRDRCLVRENIPDPDIYQRRRSAEHGKSHPLLGENRNAAIPLL